VFSGFDASGKVIHLRQPPSAGSKYFSAVFWDRTIHTRAGEVMELHDMDVHAEPDLETLPGADNVTIVECGPNQPTIKIVRDPVDNSYQEFYLGKRFGENGEVRIFSEKPLIPLFVLIEKINALDRPTEEVPRAAGCVAVCSTLVPVVSSVVQLRARQLLGQL
jgi:hypothetical protein